MVIGIAWIAFAGGMLVAAILAVVTRPEITVVRATAAAPTTIEVAIDEPATTVRTTVKPTPTTRYVPPTTIDDDEEMQRLALELALEESDMTVTDLCDAIDVLGFDGAVDSFMEGASSTGDSGFDRWIVEEFFTEKCGGY